MQRSFALIREKLSFWVHKTVFEISSYQGQAKACGSRYHKKMMDKIL